TSSGCWTASPAASRAMPHWYSAGDSWPASRADTRVTSASSPSEADGVAEGTAAGRRVLRRTSCAATYSAAVRTAVPMSTASAPTVSSPWSVPHRDVPVRPGVAAVPVVGVPGELVHDVDHTGRGLD